MSKFIISDVNVIPLDTGYEYFPMSQGARRSFNVLEFSGALVRVSTGEVFTSVPSGIFDYRIDIYSTTPLSNSPQYTEFNHNAKSQSFGNLPFYTTYNFDNGAPNLVLDSKAFWTSFGVAWDGQQMMPYIGEVRNHLGNFVIPPEPQLPKFPHEGQILDVHSSVYVSESDPTVAVPDYHTSLYVLAHVDLWKGRWEDCWVTVLTEHTGSTKVVYEYVFAKNIGIVDLWFGTMNNEGQITGYEYTLL